MAIYLHEFKLKTSGIENWNQYRERNPDVLPDLSGASLRYLDLSGADLSKADLSGADLEGANLTGADLTGARLSDAFIHGISAWNVVLEGADQSSLVITARDEPRVTVDNLDVAQFIYLLLNNEKIRDVIDMIRSKAVLILGRFTAERKAVLDALRDELRLHNYSPIVFDFDQPATLTTMETIATLAGMAHFVIADLSAAKSVLQELRGIVPDLPSVPVQPLLLESEHEPGMLDFFKKYPWFLPVFPYHDLDHLLSSVSEIITRAEVFVKESRK